MKSGHYKHPNACSLYNERHEINDKFIDVLEKVSDESDYDVEIAALGCGCVSVEMDGEINLFWIAQEPSIDNVYVNYNNSIGNDRKAAELVVDTAEEMVGVECSWTGSVDDAVELKV